MLKIGRYGIAFGRTFWFQTQVPTRVRHFLCFWFIKEARASDIDKKRQFPPNTLLEQEGRRYRYWKAGEDIVVKQPVTGEEILAMKVWEILGISPDDYMMLYWDFPNERVMAIDHVGKHTPVGDIYDIVEGDAASFKIRKLMVNRKIGG